MHDGEEMKGGDLGRKRARGRRRDERGEGVCVNVGVDVGGEGALRLGFW